LVRSIGRGLAVVVNAAVSGQEIISSRGGAISKFVPAKRAVEYQILGALGWCRWLAVSRSFFFMEVSKSR
jgi:hypothetical protein